MCTKFTLTEQNQWECPQPLLCTQNVPLHFIPEAVPQAMCTFSFDDQTEKW